MPASVTLNSGTMSDTGHYYGTYGNFINSGTATITANGAGNSISAGIGMPSGITFNTPNSGDDLTVSGILGSTIGGGNTGSLTKSGSGAVTLTGENTYSGLTTVANGTLTINNGNVSATGNQALGTSTSVSLGVSGTSSGILNYTGTTGTLAKNINALGNGSDTVQNVGTGLLTLSGTLTKNGTTLALKGGSNGILVSGRIVGTSGSSDLVIASGTTTLSATNSYNGPTYVNNSGTLVNGITNALPIGTTLVLGGTDNTVGSYDLAGYNQTIASLISQGLGAPNVITNSSGASDSELKMSNGGTFAGLITDGATKKTKLYVDGGTLTLTGSNSYTGATTINSGTLALQNPTGAALSGTTPITVNTGGTLLLGGSNQINDAASVNLNGGTFKTGAYNETVGALTLSGSSTIDFNNSATASTLTFSSGSYTSGLLTVLNWSGGFGGGTNTHLMITSDPGVSFLGNVQFSGYSLGATWNAGELAPIPEPATIIGALAFVGLIILRERRRLRVLWAGLFREQKQIQKISKPVSGAG